ncbi:MAG TPA: HlyD family type I secretion periplasmic adaptor subunit [Stellaceae bacterium]|nr:HlyD family type I secretion periplasmic adaptor subunit [Stellaceae bacterium]
MSLITYEGGLPPAPATPLARCRRLVLFGAVLVGVFVLGLGVWSAFAPLESAVVAGGVVVSDSHRKTIQHLEGGIIKEILVQDGDAVTAGEILVRLDDTKARTAYATAAGELRDARAAEARLVAERDGTDAITFPADLVAHQDDPAVAQAIAGQQKIFDAWKLLQKSKVDAIGERINQSKAEIAGFQAESVADTSRGALLNEEIKSVASLVNQGLERKGRLLELERQLVDTQGKAGDLMAQIARAKETVAEGEVDILSLKNDDQKRAADDLRDTQQKLGGLAQTTAATAAVLARTDVKAPEDGTVTNLRVHTPGGVVNPGEPLLDLVPKDDRLVIEARVRPVDIDRLREGLPAEVRLLPYRTRRTPPLDASVTYVSADELNDKEARQSYFAVKLAIDPQELKDRTDVKLVPGMPAEAMIRTGKSTVALYALSPILDSFHRAFREK